MYTRTSADGIEYRSRADVIARVGAIQTHIARSPHCVQDLADIYLWIF